VTLRPPSAAVRLRPGSVEWREVEGEVVAVDVRTSEYLAINATGAVLWRALQDGATRGELRERLVASFDVEPGLADRDIGEFLAALDERGLLE
jgi:Coenzyme PQQ synthesis protein D (PqqD)